MKKTTPENESQILQRIADAGGLNRGVAGEVARATGVPAADVYGAGSFYHLLAHPETRIRICQGLSCYLAGARTRLQEARAAGLPAEGCSCLAECDRPVAILNGRGIVAGIDAGAIAAQGGDWAAILDAGVTNAGVTEVPACALGTDSGDRLAEGSADDQLAVNLPGACDFSGAAFARAVHMGPDAVVEALERSGLQGRGGAGFPAGRKWRALLGQPVTTRYVVLNADEGEPGTFKDRDVLLLRPDLVVEGLAIAAAMTGAADVYCYLRGEFARPRRALTDAIDRFVGSAMFPNIRFHIHDGHGAYICGEETAMLEAIEGKRGMPRLKPPFPTEQGLWGKPTLIHNVETIACVPAIVCRGGDWFRDLGRTGPGTKLYCISGHVRTPGTYELPLGVTLDELVAAAGGYEGDLLAFSPGGASSGFLPASERDRPLDWPSLNEAGSSLGSAGVVVLNDTVDITRAVRQTLRFFEVESCGQCAPCRTGTRFVRDALDRFIETGRPDALARVEDAAWEMTEGSICGLGYSAAIPLLNAMKHFPEAFAG